MHPLVVSRQEEIAWKAPEGVVAIVLLHRNLLHVRVRVPWYVLKFLKPLNNLENNDPLFNCWIWCLRENLSWNMHKLHMYMFKMCAEKAQFSRSRDWKEKKWDLVLFSQPFSIFFQTDCTCFIVYTVILIELLRVLWLRKFACMQSFDFLSVSVIQHPYVQSCLSGLLFCTFINADRNPRFHRVVLVACLACAGRMRRSWSARVGE